MKKDKLKIMKIIQTLFIALLLTGCSEKFNKVSEDKFIGIWEIKGVSMLEGMQIRIQNENNQLIGRIYKLNENKYVEMFADSSDIWISDIKRNSNYEFKLTENKIGKELFSVYGLKTSEDFKVEFIDENTFGIAGENSDPLKSSRIYRRINNAR